MAGREMEQILDEIRDFRQATTTSFNAMREDLTDLRTQVDHGFAQVDRGFAAVDRGLAEVRGRLDGMAAGIEQINGLLHTVIGQRDDDQ